MITPRHFEIFDVRPLRGRTFTQADADGSLPVALVTQRFVDRFLGTGDPVGRRVKLGADTEPWRTVVGVVPDMHIGGAIGQLDPQDEGVYVPLAQNVINFMSLIVRTDRAPATYASAIQGAINQVDPTLPLYWVRSLDDQYRLDTTFYRLFGTLFTAFGVAALALGVVGLYGVMSFSVSNRIREIGVRMALGAQPGTVRLMILQQGAVQIAVGGAIGLALAALLSRGLGILLFDVKPWDPVVFTVVIGALATAGLVACLVPARRATRVDPGDALRYE